MFYIPSLTNILSQLSPIQILNFTFVPYILFVSFCLRGHLLSKVLSFGYFLQIFLYVSLPYSLGASSHLTFFSIILTLFINLLITKLPVILFHPALLALPLFTSRYLPCNLFLSKTLRLTCSLNISYKPHTHNKKQLHTTETPNLDVL